jgi:hypothetical protein
MIMFVLILATTSLAAPSAMNITSIYTDLTGSKCKLVQEDKETGSSLQKCPGVGGFHLLVADDDARQSVTIVDAYQKEHPLDYWNVITRSFSSLGKKAEWRVVKHAGKIKPIALIVRVNVSEQVDLNLPHKTSFLVVAKISPEVICVTHKVPPAADANAQARRFADVSMQMQCLQPLS